MNEPPILKEMRARMNFARYPDEYAILEYIRELEESATEADELAARNQDLEYSLSCMNDRMRKISIIAEE